MSALGGIAASPDRPGRKVPMTGEDVIRAIRDRTDTILLSFSCGKDSIAMWNALRGVFPNIVPYYLYLVPGLEFVEESLQYYESFYGTRIHRLPHPSLARMLRNLVYCPPHRVELLDSIGYPEFTYDDAETWLCQDLGFPEKLWSARGVRAADSPMRRTTIVRWGAISEKRRSFFPIWDWKKADLLESLRGSGVRLPVDNRIFGRSFDGLDRRFLEPIREHFPRDYERILEWFPLADLDLLRYNHG